MTGRVMRAEIGGTVLAESGDTLVVDGNHYFPRDSVSEEYLRPSKAASLCYWKGLARYHAIEVEDLRIGAAAWYYPQPYPWIRKIKDHVAFGPGIEVHEVTPRKPPPPQRSG